MKNKLMLAAFAVSMSAGTVFGGDALPSSITELRTEVKNNTNVPVFVSWRSASKVTRAIEKLGQKLTTENLILIEPNKSKSIFHTGDKLYVLAMVCKNGKTTKLEKKHRPTNKGYTSVTIELSASGDLEMSSK